MPTRFGKFISGKHFSKVFLLFYLLFMCLAAYETYQALCLLTNQPHLFGVVYVVFALVAVLVLTKKSTSLKRCNRTYKIILSFLSCFLIYHALTLLIWELVCIFFKPTEKIKAIGVIGSVVVAVLTVLVGYIHTKNIKVKPYKITLGKGNGEFRIALLSDIHLGVFVGEKHVQRMVRKINSLNPDIVVISGDIFDVDNSLLKDTVRLKRISKLLSKIKTSEGVYAVVGNHDPEISDKAFKHFLKATKIKLLDNEHKELSRINLIGRSDASNNERKALEDILSTAESDKPIVVLDHKPENIKENIEGGADLVLCGHTHRGQMFPITLFTKWANGKDCFYGHSVTDNAHSIVTSGVGFFELPMRLGTNNEIVDIVLNL